MQPPVEDIKVLWNLQADYSGSIWPCSQQSFCQVLRLQDMKDPYIPKEVIKDFLIPNSRQGFLILSSQGFIFPDSSQGFIFPGNSQGFIFLSNTANQLTCAYITSIYHKH